MGVSLDLIIRQPQTQGITVFELDAVSVISARLAVLIFIFVKACAVVKKIEHAHAASDSIHAFGGSVIDAVTVAGIQELFAI